MSSAEGYAMALGDPVLGLQLPLFCSQCVGPTLPPHHCLCWSPAPLKTTSSALGTCPPFLEQAVAQQPLGSPPMETEGSPSAALGIHTPSAPTAQPQPDSLCITVSLVYSSISPWMRRNRGIFPLNSCFRIVEYTSSPGHGGRGMGKGRQLLEVPPPNLGHWTQS